MRSAVDIGCGPGNSTEVLAARYPQADVRGFDSSADMIDAARRRLPNLRFEVLDLKIWIEDAGGAAPSQPIDVLLANAVLQWVPDHAALFPALVRKLAPRRMSRRAGAGQSRRARAESDARNRTRGPVAGQAGRRRAGAGAYRAVRLVLPAAAPALRTRRCVADHAITIRSRTRAQSSSGSRGTGLRPFLDPLDPPERDEYLARYTERIAQAHPAALGGEVLLPFPRLFIVATR